MTGPETNGQPRDVVVSAWGQVADGYDAYWVPRFAPFVQEALAAFEPGPGALGVPGCGPGAEVEALADRFPERRIVATDPAEAMLARARTRLADRPRVEVVRGRATEPSQRLQESGGLFTSFMLQLLDDPGAALRDWRRALAPGGEAAVLFWPQQPRDSAWGRLRAAVERVTGQRRGSFESTLEASLPRLGWRAREVRTLEHRIEHAGAAEAWRQLVEAGPLQVFLRRVGPEVTARCRAAWLDDHGLHPDGDSWCQDGVARLWRLEAV